MLILEGADLVGKTTLAKKLCTMIGGRHVYKHFSRLPHSFDRYWGYVEHAARHSVQDRFHMSEVYYAYARGDRTMLSPAVYRLVDGHLRKLGAMTVVITAEEKLIRQRWGREEMYDMELVLRVNEMYRTGLEHYDMDVDFKFHCDDINPFVPEEFITGVYHEYLQRQHVLSTVLEDRPEAL